MDRNKDYVLNTNYTMTSLSARRAWIEITLIPNSFTASPVALRKESVDRNQNEPEEVRKASFVALRKESVDRNR